jgi:hypothetical protein
MNHLRTYHLEKVLPHSVSVGALREFLVPVAGAERLLKLGHLTNILEKCKERLLRFCKCASEIQAGLVSDGKFSTPINQLPAPLILAFERFILFWRCTNYLVLSIDAIFSPSLFSHITSLSVEPVAQSIQVLELLSQDAERYMHKAQIDIVYALSTGKHLHRGNFYNEVGPNYVVGKMVWNLLGNPLLKGQNIVQIYSRYLENVVSAIYTIVMTTKRNTTFFFLSFSSFLLFFFFFFFFFRAAANVFS